MNWNEIAEYLRMKGYDVYEVEGVDAEAFIFGYNQRPIKVDKVIECAKKEGFIFDDKKSVWLPPYVSKYKEKAT